MYILLLKGASPLRVCRVTHTHHLANNCGPEKKPIMFAGTLNQTSAARLRLTGDSCACRHCAPKGVCFISLYCSNGTKKQRHVHVRANIFNHLHTNVRVPSVNRSLIWAAKTGQMPVSLERFR